MKLAKRYGWLPGARYSNLRDIRGIEEIGLIDIEWEAYSFDRHLAAVKAVRPLITVARDLTSIRDTARLLGEVEMLRRYVKYVVIVPKTRRFAPRVKMSWYQHSSKPYVRGGREKMEPLGDQA